MKITTVGFDLAKNVFRDRQYRTDYRAPGMIALAK
jgi:hypothetical protein